MYYEESEAQIMFINDVLLKMEQWLPFSLIVLAVMLDLAQTQKMALQVSRHKRKTTRLGKP